MSKNWLSLLRDKKEALFSRFVSLENQSAQKINQISRKHYVNDANLFVMETGALKTNVLKRRPNVGAPRDQIAPLWSRELFTQAKLGI